MSHFEMTFLIDPQQPLHKNHFRRPKGKCGYFEVKIDREYPQKSKYPLQMRNLRL